MSNKAWRAKPENRLRQRAKLTQWRANNPGRENRTWALKRAKHVAWVREFKLRYGCALCPERHIACLEFHHLNPAEKDVDISQIIGHWSMQHLEREIAKCVVLCSNCHRKLHWDERTL